MLSHFFEAHQRIREIRSNPSERVNVAICGDRKALCEELKR
jgi:hypothetical protein